MKYIFFNTLPYNKKIIIIYPYTALVFDSYILRSKIFYTNSYHSKGNISTAKKYPKEFSETKRILFDFYTQSLKDSDYPENGDANNIFPYWTIFQDIFYKMNAKLKYCKYIILSNYLKTVNKNDTWQYADKKELLTILKNKYQHVK